MLLFYFYVPMLLYFVATKQNKQSLLRINSTIIQSQLHTYKKNSQAQNKPRLLGQ